jgi:hypothetical protein
MTVTARADSLTKRRRRGHRSSTTHAWNDLSERVA